MFLFRLLINIPIAALWLLWAFMKVTTSPVSLVIGLGLCAAGIINDWADEHTIGVIAFLFLSWNRIGARHPLEEPLRFVPLFPPKQKRAKPQPLPVVTGLRGTTDAPTVREALGRLSPALRDVIANPPPKDPA